MLAPTTQMKTAADAHNPATVKTVNLAQRNRKRMAGLSSDWI